MARNTKNFVVAKKNNLKNSSKLHSISNMSCRRYKIDSGGRNSDSQSAITSVNIKENIMKNRIVTNKKSNCLVLMSVQLILLLVLLNYFVDNVEGQEIRRTRQHKAMQDRDPRKMFGGYRITPKFCTPSRPTRRYREDTNSENRGPAICMFNHECLQRQGEVVGSCMDGFLFGACCQLYGTPGVIRDTVEDGVVVPQGDINYMHAELTPDKLYNIKDQDISISVPQIISSLMDTTNVMKTTDKYESATVKEGSSSLINSNSNIEVENHFVKNPSTLSVSLNVISSTTQKYDDLDSGLAQITNTLLNQAPNDAEIVNLGKLPDTGLFGLSTISHEEPDTYLVDKNGSIIMDFAKPSDFSSPDNSFVQLSTMQTKPSIATQKPSTTSSVQPQKPVHQKPVFRPKPTKTPNNQDKFVLVQTVTKPEIPDKITTSNSVTSSQSELASIESIITMLNISQPSSVTVNSHTTLVKDSNNHPEVTTTIPQSYSSPLPLITNNVFVGSSHFPTGGHYVTTTIQKYTTLKPSVTNDNVYKPIVTKRPSTATHVSSSGFFTRKPATQPSTHHTSNKVKDSVSSSTLSYDEYWAPSDTYTSPFPVRKPPSTSYVYGPTPTKRPVSNLPNEPSNYDVGSLENFSSVTPTVIVLDSLSSQYESYTPKPTKSPIIPENTESSDNYIQIPLKQTTSNKDKENHKDSVPSNNKPVHQVTINNIISSTNMIHLGAMNPAIQPVSSTERPSPTILITPKPTTVIPALYTTQPDNIDISTITNEIISQLDDSNKNKLSTEKISTNSLPPYYTVANVRPSLSPLDLSTIKNEVVISPDDLINFPPVRNPNLDFAASTHNVFNNTISLSEVDVIPDVEFTTPALVPDDDDLNDKMSLFVNKIVGSFQGTFQELHDIVILDKSPAINLTEPTRRPTTRRPATTSKKPVKLATITTSTTKKPPSKKPKPTTRRPTTTSTLEATTVVSTRKPTKASTTPKPKPKPTKPKTTVPPTTTTVTETPVVEEEESYTTETPQGDFKHLCGVRPLVKSGRIVGGKDASFGEWPWQVLVRESTWLGLFTKNKCGGVLITNSYVTTAAHCQPGFLASLVAVMGEFDISGDLESKRSVTKNVRRVIVHRNYDAATFENDLALLELESPVVFDVHIVPICMPPDEADFTGRFATVTGWGRQKYGGGVPSILQEVKVPIIENSVCQEMFHTAGHSKIILNSFLCAGYANGQKDSCEGDSGGPLVMQRPDGRWELVGTVSHGIKCAAPYLPGVYMRTTFYKPWLKSITGVQ